jgi:hypothetical protein
MALSLFNPFLVPVYVAWVTICLCIFKKIFLHEEFYFMRILEGGTCTEIRCLMSDSCERS